MFAVVFLLAGCRTCDKVESELRKKEMELREVRDELCQQQLMNEALQRDLHAIAETHPVPGGPEAVHATNSVQTIALGRQTGGYREECGPGDAALQVVVEPRDCDNHSIKAPGSLRVLALEVGPDGLKKPLSSWELTPLQLSRCWKSGLWSSGYYVILPWKVWPTTEKLRVVAQFQTPDGRVFEADKDVTLHLPPADKRAPVAPPVETLPPPKPLEPEGGKDGPALSQAVHLGRPQR